MELKVHLTKNDYSAFRRFAMFKLRKTWLMFLPLVAFVAWTSFSRDYANRGWSLVIALITSFVLALIVAGGRTSIYLCLRCHFAQ